MDGPSDFPDIIEPPLLAEPDRSPILLDTLFLVGLRVVWFLLSRRFLLFTITPTLRQLSSNNDELLPQVNMAQQQDSLGLDEPDTEDDRSPGTSYPPSPAGRTLPLPDRNMSSSSLSDGIELEAVGNRLLRSSRSVQVLQLSHGKQQGTKAAKKATRGLHRAARVLFSLCAAESMNLITLVLLHSLGILHARSRHVNFSFSLHVLLALILIVVPLEQCLLLTYRSRDTNATAATTTSGSSLPMQARLLISLIPFSLYGFLFTRIPPYVTAVPEELTDDGTKEGWEGEGWLASSMGRVIVLGIIVLGGLSGFGAVRTAWNFIEHLKAGRRAVSDADILQVERSLYRIRQDMAGKQEEMSRVLLPGGDRSWMGRFFGSKAGQEASSLQAEMRGLQALERQVTRSLKTMKARKRRQDFGHSLQGRIYNVFGYAFAVYCAARLLMCLPAIFFATSRVPVDNESEGAGNTNGDWISFLLAMALSHLPTGSYDIDIAVWARTISLLLTGALILSSLAQVLRSLTRILKLTSKTVGAGFLLLSLGQLFATYVISLLVQLRTTIPDAPEVDTDPFSPFYSNTTATIDLTHHGPDVSLLASLPDFRVFGRLFDLTFLMSAVFTLAYRYIAVKINGMD